MLQKCKEIVGAAAVFVPLALYAGSHKLFASTSTTGYAFDDLLLSKTMVVSATPGVILVCCRRAIDA